MSSAVHESLLPQTTEPTEPTEPKKLPLLWEHALIAAVFWGSSNFFYSKVTTKDFPTVCQSWTGFIITSILYRSYEIYSDSQPRTSLRIKEILFKNLSNKGNLLHQAIRTVNWFVYIWLTIIVGNMAKEAQMNPGIAYGLLSTSIIMAAAYTWVIWKEPITLKMCIGIAIVLVSVIWMSLAQGEAEQKISSTIDVTTQNDDLNSLKIQTIAVGLVLAFVASLRPIQARWVDMYREYAPLDFSVDSGFISGIILFFISTYYYLIGHPSYTAANMLNSFLGSTLMTFWGLSGLYSMVKGQMAPSMAIQQTHSVFSIILGVVFLGLDVTVSQILAALGIIIGCAFIKLYN